ncbi:MAG: oligopeptide ABC transporter ATP-binding protein [Thermoprotei archaeon]|nr:MAG: oligopeptide ABC transporter ATP-binding protein [Thermoprotei archaeon]
MVRDDLIIVKDLKKYFPIRAGLFGTKGVFVRAVDGVSLTIKRGETFGLAGESGCGKSTFARLLLRLIEPTAGKVLFDGIDLFSLSKKELRKLRRRMGIVFQDPKSSLNPRMTIYNILKRPLEIHGIGSSKEERLNMIIEILEKVGLGEEHLNRYPHELSGGQQQRVSIARAIITKPDFVVLDEPTSALDISVQAQILNLLVKLQREFKLTYLFITHNLMVLQYISDRVGIMYLGKVVEIMNTRDELNLGKVYHPYTAFLMLSIPAVDIRERRRDKIIVPGEVPSSINPPTGCRFHPRCPFAKEECKSKEPPLLEIRRGHYVACHFPSITEEKLTPYVEERMESIRRLLRGGS